MIKGRLSMIFAVIMFSFSVIAFANSGPVFWQGYPSSEMMSIEENSPITVKNENLTFDFSDYGDSADRISGKVKATYEMGNPTKEAHMVQMAFPLVGTLDSQLLDDITITDDDSVLPYKMYIGNTVKNYGNQSQEEMKARFDFDSIINTITEEPYTGTSFEKNEKGKLYTLNIKPTTKQRINFAVDFNFDYEKTKVLTDGFNRYERKDEKTKIAAWCYEPETLEIFVLGEDIDLKISAYTDGALTEKTDLFTYEISTQTVEVKPYLMRYIKKNTNIENNSRVSEIQLYNVYAQALDEYFVRNMGYSSNEDLREQENHQRILTLVYTVEFPPKSQREVSVSYKTSGTMDKTKTRKPLHSFDYILNPAKNWREFRNLDIEIITPQAAPYIVRSNIEFIKSVDKVYTATLSDLPENDLSFTLYADEKITLLDKVDGNLRNRFGYFTSLVLGAIALLVIGIIIVGIVFIRKRINADRT